MSAASTPQLQDFSERVNMSLYAAVEDKSCEVAEHHEGLTHVLAQAVEDALCQIMHVLTTQNLGTRQFCCSVFKNISIGMRKPGKVHAGL